MSQSSPVSASAQIEKHLWDAIDLMAVTLEKPDPRVWAMLDIYRPRDHAQRQQDETELELLAKRIAGAELNYRDSYQSNGDSHIETGRRWDKMRKAGDAIREYFFEREETAVSDTSTDRPYSGFEVLCPHCESWFEPEDFEEIKPEDAPTVSVSSPVGWGGHLPGKIEP